MCRSLFYNTALVVGWTTLVEGADYWPSQQGLNLGTYLPELRWVFKITTKLIISGLWNLYSDLGKLIKVMLCFITGCIPPGKKRLSPGELTSTLTHLLEY